MSDILGYTEAAEYLHISVPTLKRWVSQRKVPHVRYGRSVRFVRASLRDWVAKQEIPADCLLTGLQADVRSHVRRRGPKAA